MALEHLRKHTLRLAHSLHFLDTEFTAVVFVCWCGIECGPRDLFCFSVYSWKWELGKFPTRSSMHFSCKIQKGRNEMNDIFFLVVSSATKIVQYLSVSLCQINQFRINFPKSEYQETSLALEVRLWWIIKAEPMRCNTRHSIKCFSIIKVLKFIIKNEKNEANNLRSGTAGRSKCVCILCMNRRHDYLLNARTPPLPRMLLHKKLLWALNFSSLFFN